MPENKTDKKHIEKQEKQDKHKKNYAYGQIFRMVGVLILLFIVIFLLMTFLYSQKKSAINTANMQLQILNLQKQLKQVNGKLSAVNGKMTQSEQAIAHLNEKTGAQDDDWVLSEVGYLVRLANFNLQFGHNIGEAKLLLKTANNRIATLKDPRLLPVRQSLANNIAKLAAVPHVDIEGILLKLNTMGGAITKLPVIITPEGTKSATAEAQAHVEQHESGWKRNLKESWRQIQKLVVVQYHNQPVSKLLSSENRAYLDMHLQLLLSQAEWGIMHRKENLYKQSLQEAQIWVKNYYVGDSIKTQAMLKALSSLVAIDITPTYPEVTDTLQVINQVNLRLKKN